MSAVTKNKNILLICCGNGQQGETIRLSAV